MLKVQAVLFKSAENVSAEAQLAVHHVLFNIYCRKAFLSRYARDNVFACFGGLRNDHSSPVFGTVGVADIDRYSGCAYRKNSVLVENSRTHIGKLPKLPVGYGGYGSGIVNYSRIAYKEAGNVSPVLIQLGFHRPRHNRAGHV